MLKTNLLIALFAFLSIFFNGFATSTGLSEQDKLVFKRLVAFISKLNTICKSLTSYKILYN